MPLAQTSRPGTPGTPTARRTGTARPRRRASGWGWRSPPPRQRGKEQGVQAGCGQGCPGEEEKYLLRLRRVPPALCGRRIRSCRLHGAARPPRLRWGGPGRARPGGAGMDPALPRRRSPRLRAAARAAPPGYPRLPPLRGFLCPPLAPRPPPRLLPPARCSHAAVVPAQALLPTPAAVVCPRPAPLHPAPRSSTPTRARVGSPSGLPAAVRARLRGKHQALWAAKCETAEPAAGLFVTSIKMRGGGRTFWVVLTQLEL